MCVCVCVWVGVCVCVCVCCVCVCLVFLFIGVSSLYCQYYYYAGIEESHCYIGSYDLSVAYHKFVVKT